MLRVFYTIITISELKETKKGRDMKKITVAQYLIKELNNLGIEDFFGLPGDYNFNILYAIGDNQNTNWVGCTNELNAGYAADGYARIKGYGALVTTFGVGELSAINAIAGSFAENIPVIKIVGTPATKFIKEKTVLHHNFQNPDYYAFERAFSNVVETTAFLDENNAKAEIDRILSVFIKKNRPVYVAIPEDICLLEIEDISGLEIPKSDPDSLKLATEHCLKLINNAEYPAILGDVLVKRFKAKTEFLSFVEKSQFPVSTLIMGNGIVEVDYPRFVGTFLTQFENITSLDTLKKSDCVVSVGTIICDLNTFKFSLPFQTTDFIDIQGTYTIIENRKYENVLMKDILIELKLGIEPKCLEIPKVNIGFKNVTADDNKMLSSSYIYPRFQEFLKPNDILFAETGIIPYGVAPARLPENVDFNTQTLWGSIGWATPASFGAQMAAKDRRVILITGEGSHQLTAQEISNFMKQGLNPIIIVFNNLGYTIERILSNDPFDFFNEVISWDYSKLPQVFEGQVWVAQARTEREFNDALKQAEIEQQTKMCYIEIFTEKMDVPELTQKIVDKIKRPLPTSQ